MPTTYTITFADTTKTPFIVSPYSADGPKSASDPSFISQAVRASTTLKLYGKGTPNYGEGFEQNLIYMLEHFAAPTEPVHAIDGQIWYQNGAGSPSTPPELFVRTNSNNWMPVILASGTSAMTGYLTLNADPTNSLHAATKQYADSIGTDTIATLQPLIDAKVNRSGDTMTGILNMGSNKIEGLADPDTSDDAVNLGFADTRYINVTGDTMNSGADLTFSGGGQVLGLPLTPVGSSAAASKYYVDTQLGSGAGGDGVLSAVSWLPGTGTVGSITDNIIELTVSYPGSPGTATFTLDGVSRVGHGHDAVDVLFDNTSIPSYPTDLQNVIEFIDSNKASTSNPTFTGIVTVSGSLISTNIEVDGTLLLDHNPVSGLEAATKQYVDSVISGSAGPSATVNILRDLLPTVGGSPAQRVYEVPVFVADTNSLFVYVDGLKQFCHSYNGKQTLSYNSTVISITELSSTYLDTTNDYHFNVTVDGVGPTLIAIPTGSSISTHGELANTINSILNGLMIDASFSIVNSETEMLKSHTSGSGASILIEDPNTGGSPTYNYLFNVPTPISILRPEFVGDFTDPDPGNWTIPDELIITGDVTTDFPVGKIFTVIGSDTDYGPYDAILSVFTTGSSYNGGTNETTIPVASALDSSQPTPLIFGYSTQVGGSPAPSVPVYTTAGNILLTNIGGLISVNTPTVGVDGDYREVVYAGSPAVTIQATPGTATTFIEFNYDIPSGSKLEANVFA